MIFDLGKRPLIFQINNENDGILFGTSEETTEGIKLSLVYKEINPNSETDEKTIESYMLKSKPQNEFDEKEARRYLKSRFRETLQEVNRIGDANGHLKHEFLTKKHREYNRKTLNIKELI